MPTLFALLVTIPAMAPHAGLFGVGLGLLTPLFVLLSYWATWAVPAYLWVGLCGTFQPLLKVALFAHSWPTT